MSSNFTIKIDLRKNLVGFECFKCSSTTFNYSELGDNSVKVTCPKCQRSEIYEKKPFKEGEKRPFQWLFT